MNDKPDEYADHGTDYCAIGLSNPKSPSNVGAVMRACGCFSADHIFYTGTRYDRAEPFYTDTANRREEIPLTHVDTVESVIESRAHLPCESLKLVCVELCENATPLPSFKHPAQAIYLFGPEDYSLSQETIDRADHVVFIPTNGCLNLSATVNVVLYDRQLKQAPGTSHNDYDELIRNSRDCRNNLIVKG